MFKNIPSGRMKTLALLQEKYPTSQAWAFGNLPELANDLATLVAKGIKTASCCSLTSYLQDLPITPGSYHIILDGENRPVCVIRMMTLRLLRFDKVTEADAYREGEGDKSLAYWQQAHRDFFKAEGTFAEDMELIVTEFQLAEVI